MQNILTLEVNDKNTNILYVDNGVKMFEYDSPIGMNYILENKLSEKAANDWFSYVLWALHSISYVERIPTTFYIRTRDHKVWFQSVIERYSYTQFYTNNQRVRAIILDNSQNYGRHQKTIAKFAI